MYSVSTFLTAVIPISQVEEFGVRELRELKPGGKDIVVTDDNKQEYVKLVCQMKMTGMYWAQYSYSRKILLLKHFYYVDS